MRTIGYTDPFTQNKLDELSLFAGYSSSFSNDKYALIFSAIGNLSHMNGYAVANYQKYYVFPKISASYSINDNHTLTIAFSSPTYRPNLSSLVNDSNYTNNWLVVKGDNQLKTETEYNLDVLWTSTFGKKFSMETSYSASYFDNGIVTSYSKENNVAYLFNSSWLNCNYWLQKFAISWNLDLSNNFSIRSDNILHYVNFLEKNQTSSYNKGFYYSGNYNVNYTIPKVGEISILADWSPLNRLYSIQKKGKAFVDFSFSKSISKNMSLYFAIYDIFNTKENKISNYQNGLYSHQMQNSRSISLTFTYKLGQMFAVRNAGTGSGDIIPSDTKK